MYSNTFLGLQLNALHQLLQVPVISFLASLVGLSLIVFAICKLFKNF